MGFNYVNLVVPLLTAVPSKERSVVIKGFLSIVGVLVHSGLQGRFCRGLTAKTVICPF